MRRVKILFSPTEESVDINNQHLLNSYIHKCLGNNNKYHDAKSNYNISHLYGGKLNMDKKTLSFKNGAYIVVSSIEDGFINELLAGILTNMNISIFGDMKFQEVVHMNGKFHDGWNNFMCLSPFMIKQFIPNEQNKMKYKFLTYKDKDFNEKVREHIVNKLSKIDNTLKLDDLKVEIPVHSSHKIKTSVIRKPQKGRKDIKIVANQCAINIYTNKKVAKYLYHLGLGMSTGSGFGTIYESSKRENYI